MQCSYIVFYMSFNKTIRAFYYSLFVFRFYYKVIGLSFINLAGRGYGPCLGLKCKVRPGLGLTLAVWAGPGQGLGLNSSLRAWAGLGLKNGCAPRSGLESKCYLARFRRS